MSSSMPMLASILVCSIVVLFTPAAFSELSTKELVSPLLLMLYLFSGTLGMLKTSRVCCLRSSSLCPSILAKNGSLSLWVAMTVLLKSRAKAKLFGPDFVIFSSILGFYVEIFYCRPFLGGLLLIYSLISTY